MILTKEIELRIAGNVLNYYKNNNINIIPNKINKIPIELLNPESHILIDAKCDICGKEVKIQYRRYNQSISRGGYYTCSSKCSTDKRSQTFMDKWGVKAFVETNEFKEKSKNTSIKKWGEDHFRKSEKWKNNNNENLKRKNTIFSKFITENPKVLGQDDENFIIKCDIHGETLINKKIFSTRKIIGTELCTMCKPINSNISGKEILLYKLIKELYDGEVVQSYKVDRKEIDVYLPDLKIGFEFNGLRFHSEIYKDKNYHIKKTLLCEKHNIRLVHIFEDDFDMKLDIVKSIILNLIGKSKKIYGRKTELKKINNKEIVKDFLNKNHLQGFVNSNINYGLYYNNELVSLMTFMKSRKVFNKKTKDGDYELVRFCNKLNFTIIGGASKLFKQFINEYSPKNILSYCDISWANGNLYSQLGMKLIGITKPNYHYIVDKVRKNRIEYQKHKLVKKGFDINLTEHEIMNSLGYFKIYNCGNKIFNYEIT